MEGARGGLPILWEPPSGGDMRGRLWMSSPGGVRRRRGRAHEPGARLQELRGAKGDEATVLDVRWSLNPH